MLKNEKYCHLMDGALQSVQGNQLQLDPGRTHLNFMLTESGIVENNS